MKRRIFLITGVLAAACMGQEDESSKIFNDTVVNDYSISFYEESWDSLLVYNKANDEEYMAGRFVYRSPDGDSIVLDSIGIRYKGNSSYTFSGSSQKKPFKFYFNKYRKDQLFFGMEKLNFSNSVKDPSCMREKIAYSILGKYMPSPRAAFATITVEDSLVKGLYTQVEQVDELFLLRHFGNDEYNLYKSSDDGTQLGWKNPNQQSYEGEYELKTNDDPPPGDWSGLIEMLLKLNNTSDNEFVMEAGNCLDLDNCIRYLAFNMVNCNFDSYTGSGRNIYLYDDEEDGRFKLIPWDLDQSFGMYYPGFDVITVDAFCPPNLDLRPLVKRILANDSLKKAYARYMEEMIAGPASADSVGALAHRYKQVIDASVQNDTKKYFSYEQFVTGIDSDIVIMEGPKKTILPGLRSVTAYRAEQLTAQIADVLPVVTMPPARSPCKTTLRYACTAGKKRVSINYSIPETIRNVVIELVTLGGTRTRSVNLGMKPKGAHATALSTETLTPGVYVLSLKAGKYSASVNMMVSN